MKILLYSDVHWSTYGSIVRKRNDHYSERLDNLIKSVSWAEHTADVLFCDKIVCLGDFFDKPELSAEEISALNEVTWSSKPHVFLVGNHESNVSSLVFSSTKVFGKFNNFTIVDEPLIDSTTDCKILYLPYILEDDRKPIYDYWKSATHVQPQHEASTKRRLIFSHNDLKNVQYGGFKSKVGFDLADIEKQCDLFINGHLHNGEYVDKAHKILNLGNLTGLNFSEDAFNYLHRIAILDTETGKLEFIENPFAFNFYKLCIDSVEDLQKLTVLKGNAVCTIDCDSRYVEDMNKVLAHEQNICDSRVIITSKSVMVNDEDVSKNISRVDHLAQFKAFALTSLGATDIVKEELTLICGGDKVNETQI